jgi:hypothetical protein
MIKADLYGALSRGYCTEKNKHKVVDPDLIEAMANEVILLFRDKPKKKKLTCSNCNHYMRKDKMKIGHYKDDRLPKGFTVYHNAFDEWVVCDESGRVAKIDNENNVAASRRNDGAVVNWQMKLKTTSEVTA